MKILLVAYFWGKTKDSSYKEALEKLGHEVHVFDIFSFFPNNNGKKLNVITKIINRLLYIFRAIRMNRGLIRMAVKLNPELIITLKAKEIFPGTIVKIKSLNTGIIFNVSTDDIFSPRYPSNSSRWLKKSISLYHCIFTNKPWALRRELMDCGAQRTEYLQFASNPSVNKEAKINRSDLGADVVFVGSPEKERIETLEYLAKNNVNLKVYGPDWHKFVLSPELKKCVMGKPVYEEEMAIVYSSSKIILVFVRRGDRDLTNSRVFEAPACGAFSLMERNKEILRYYEEGKDIECFSNPEEALQKINKYIDNEEERNTIAKSGKEKAITYNFDSRVEKIMDVFESMWNTDSISS